MLKNLQVDVVGLVFVVVDTVIIRSSISIIVVVVKIFLGLLLIRPSFYLIAVQTCVQASLRL